MKNRDRVVFTALLVFTFLVTVGLGGPALAEKNVLRFGMGLDPNTLDPHNYKASRETANHHQKYG